MKNTNPHLRDLMKDVDFRNYVRGDTLESMINERKDFVVFE
jgi:hypothetical protein